MTQEHVILMSPGPAADDPLRYAADTLALAVGDDSGSRLYWALVDPGLAESADMQLPRVRGDRGVLDDGQLRPGASAAKTWTSSAGCWREVQRDGITEEELHQAKSKIGSRVVRGSERPMGRDAGHRRTWTYLGKYRSVGRGTGGVRRGDAASRSARCSTATRSTR